MATKLSLPKKAGVKRPRIGGWNKGKLVGPKKPFTTDQVFLIEATLKADPSTTAIRDRALFRFAIDTMLRSIDLRAVSWSQVIAKSGGVVDSFQVRQQKTGNVVTCFLQDKCKEALQAYWVEAAGFNADPVFPLCHKTYSRIVKQCAAIAHLDPADYSTHSLRRTKATVVYNKTKDVEIVRQMLGQKTLGATAVYLGIGKAEVAQAAKDNQL